MATAILVLSVSLWLSANGSAQLPTEINLGLGEANFVVHGEAAGDFLTENRGIVLGDLNGDGIDDFVLHSFTSLRMRLHVVR